jgi:hypothetical protein
MCDSLEVMRTTGVPGGLSGNAWVRPVLQPLGFGIAGTGMATRIMDASGASTTYLDDLTCGGWASSSSPTEGLYVDGTGRFQRSVCTSSLQVACCEPVSGPPVAAGILWFGRGLLAAMILSAGAFMIFFRGQPVLGSGKRSLLKRG